MGTPTIIMQDGKFIYKNFKKIKIDMNDFLESARGKGYFDISEIKYAIMEADGKISFMPKEEYKNVIISEEEAKRLDLINDETIEEGLVANIIIDGKVISKNLININKNEIWLQKQLEIKGFDSYKDILLATVDINEKLNIYKKEKNKDIINVLE